MLQTDLEVKHGADIYFFNIPSMYDEIKIGARMRDIHAEISPGFTVNSLDGTTLYYLRACATFDVLLTKASVSWVFSQNKTGPTVDSSKFPRDKFNTILEVFTGFDSALATFRKGGDSDDDTASAEAVVGSENTGT